MKGELRRKLCKEITGYAREGPFAQLLIRDNSQFHLGKSIFEPYTFDLQNIEERLAAEKIRSWMQRANVKKRSQKTVGDKHAKPSAKADQKKNIVTISREDYDLLRYFARRALKVIEYLSDPEEIERQRIKVETMERGTFQPGVGWTYMNHLEPVVSAELSGRYERRKEIILKGTWNASRKGWEYNGDFTGIWG